MIHKAIKFQKRHSLKITLVTAAFLAAAAVILLLASMMQTGR